MGQHMYRLVALGNPSESTVFLWLRHPEPGKKSDPVHTPVVGGVVGATHGLASRAVAHTGVTVVLGLVCFCWGVAAAALEVGMHPAVPQPAWLHLCSRGSRV